MHAYLICRNLSLADHAAEVERQQREEWERQQMVQPAYASMAVTGGGYMARRGL